MTTKQPSWNVFEAVILLGCVSKVISRRNYASQSSVAAK